MVWAAPARPWRVVAAQDSAKRDTRAGRQEPSPPQTTTSAVARQRARLRLKLQLSNTLTSAASSTTAFLFTLAWRREAPPLQWPLYARAVAYSSYARGSQGCPALAAGEVVTQKSVAQRRPLVALAIAEHCFSVPVSM